MTRCRFGLLLLMLSCSWCAPACADKFSDSYLSISAAGDKIEGQWDIALRDLDFAVGLDQDGNGALTWDEVRTRHAAIAAYALARLSLSTPDGICTARPTQQLIDQHSDGAYSVLRFSATCPSTVKTLTIRYSLLFDIDPQHKGLLKLVVHGVASTAIFSPEHRAQSFQFEQLSRFEHFSEYVKTGIGHIWIGFDHLLFLFSLLLPSVLILSGSRWAPSPGFKGTLVNVLKIVTAFTLAHSITLTLATLQIIALPSRWVESAIAASVIVAALNNLFPVIRERRWLVAFAFGLVHGFGFASVLTDLDLPRSALLLALVGFNLGVEIGQLTIVALFLPVAYVLRKTWFYRKMVFTVGSMFIIFLASVWFVERAFNLQLISANYCVSKSESRFGVLSEIFCGTPGDVNRTNFA